MVYEYLPELLEFNGEGAILVTAVNQLGTKLVTDLMNIITYTLTLS